MKKLLFVILGVAAASLAFWAWIRYNPPKTPDPESVEVEGAEGPENNAFPNHFSDESDEAAAEIPRNEKPYAEILPDDCTSECQRFSEEKKLKYCQEACGLASPQNQHDSCTAESDLEKDYCLKDRAIREKNFSWCEKIADPKIAETCRNRITEDIIDQ